VPIFTDQMERTVEIKAAPRRIISIVPSQTELLYDLGLSDEVIGITKFCVHPEEWFRTKTRVGGTKKLNIELIKSLNPDLIIGNKEENEQSQIEELAKSFPVWMSDVQNLKDALQMINEMGGIFNRVVKAMRLNDEIARGFMNFEIRNPFGWGKKHPTVAYCIWNEPKMVAGGDTFIDDMLQHCGLKNIFQNLQRYPEISPAQLADGKPELIFLSSEPFPFKEKHVKDFKLICPDAKVMLVDGEMFSWYGSRLLKAPSYFKQLIEQICG
jgi:ABC-type Fe3+-hydroxamate transport system substrate-binding protein